MWRANAWAPFIIALYPGKPDNSPDDIYCAWVYEATFNTALSFTIIYTYYNIVVCGCESFKYSGLHLADSGRLVGGNFVC